MGGGYDIKLKEVVGGDFYYTDRQTNEILRDQKGHIIGIDDVKEFEAKFPGIDPTTLEPHFTCYAEDIENLRTHPGKPAGNKPIIGTIADILNKPDIDKFRGRS